MTRYLVALGCGLLLWATPVAEGRATRCAPSGAKPVAGSDRVSVYVRKRVNYVCAYKTGKTRRIGDERGIFSIRVAGRFVAYMRSFGGFGSSSEKVILVDGVTRKRIDIGEMGCSEPIQGPVVIDAFALSETWALVWACSDRGVPSTVAQEVRRHDACGNGLLARSVATGPYAGVRAPSFVAISARRSVTDVAEVAYWTLAGRDGSAPLGRC